MFGVGDPEATIIFVGEGPGEDENKSGEPFVGQAGKILDGLLRRLNLIRGKGVYICNIVKCWPGPGNPEPEPAEIATCLPLLHLQIRIIRPKVIVALGRTAAVALTGLNLSVRQFRERARTYQNEVTGLSCPVISTYHPSYILRKSKEDPPLAKEGTLNVLSDIEEAIRIVGQK